MTDEIANLINVARIPTRSLGYCSGGDSGDDVANLGEHGHDSSITDAGDAVIPVLRVQGGGTATPTNINKLVCLKYPSSLRHPRPAECNSTPGHICLCLYH